VGTRTFGGLTTFTAHLGPVVWPLNCIYMAAGLWITQGPRTLLSSTPAKAVPWLSCRSQKCICRMALG